MSLHHLRLGTGPVLVLLHGLGSHGAVWEPIVPRLAARRDLLIPDLPGFGQSLPLPAGVAPTVEALATAVAAFLDELGLDRPHLAGNSLGGWVALELARLGRAASVTLVSPGGFWSEGERRQATAALRVMRWAARHLGPLAPHLLARPLGRRLLLGQIFAHPELIPAAVALADSRAFAAAPGFEATLAAADRPGSRFRHGEEITCPITLVWGEKDRLLPPRQARRAAAALPTARLVLLPDCGHTPMWDDPERLARLLLEGSSGESGHLP